MQPAATRTTSLRYRPGLDGLRGVAVLAVLLYHGGAPFAPGGFLGVDVFFVLSGFLITGILLSEWQQWGSIDLVSFYKHRARRLLPALFAMLAVVSIWTLLGPASRRDGLRGDLLATLGYVSNWHFITSGDSYFAQFNAPSPLLHTWSLAIEEQWYVIFPIVLIAVLKLVRQRGTLTPRVRRSLAGGLLLAALASALLMSTLVHKGQDPSRAYYGTDTRAQELLVGAALAAFSNAGRRVELRRLVRKLGPVPLLGLIVAVVTVHDNELWMYHGGFLLMSLLSALVVMAAASRAGLTVRILSFEPLRRVGLISYGLYLWHWPVFVFLDQDRLGFAGVGLFTLRIVVSFGFALISYRYIEQPIRTGALRRRVGLARNRTAWVGAFVVTAIVILVGTTGGVPSTAEQIRGGVPVTQRFAGEPLAYLVGDSVPYGLRLYFPHSRSTGFAVDGSTQLGCGLIPSVTYIGDVATALPDYCPTWSQNWPAAAAAAHPDLGVVFVGIGELLDQQEHGKRVRVGTSADAAHIDAWLTRSVDALLAAGATKVALMNEPCHGAIPGTEGDLINSFSRIGWVNQVVADYAKAHPTTTTMIDLFGFLCSGGYTNTRDGVTLRDDGLHFTEAGSHVVWAWLTPQLRQLIPPTR